MNTLLAGVSSRRIPTSRLTVNVLELPGRKGIPVVFVHGNVSSSLFWQPTMLALPAAYRPIAVDLRGFGDTDPAPVDATRGVLGGYAAPDGAYREVVIADSGHGPFSDHPRSSSTRCWHAGGNLGAV